MIEAKDIYFSYQRSALPVLRGVSLEVKDGEFVALLGTNGAGKSTLVNILSGFEKPNSGKVFINASDIANMPAERLARVRAVLEQSFEPAFDPTVLELVLMGRYAKNCSLGNSDEDRAAAVECLKLTGLDGFSERRYSTLSGGEKRRANISRVVSQIYSDSASYKGKNLLLDEPCAALDPAHSLLALRMAKKLSLRGASVLCVLHDPNQAFRFADKIILLKDGKVCASGNADKIADQELLSDIYGAKCAIIRTPDGFPAALFS